MKVQTAYCYLELWSVKIRTMSAGNGPFIRELSFSTGKGGRLLVGGDQNFFRWSKGGGVIFFQWANGEGQNFLSIKKGRTKFFSQILLAPSAQFLLE